MGLPEGIITTIIIAIIIVGVINIAVFFAIMKLYTINDKLTETNAILKGMIQRQDTSLNIQARIEQNTRKNNNT